MALLKRSRIKQVAIGLLVVTASCVVAVSGVNVFTNKKHSEPSVPKESILSLLDDNLPLLEGESFTMNDINNINEHHLAHDLDAVVKTDFFSTFKADINSPCSFGPVYSQCALEGGCDVTDGHTPDPWREFDHSPYKPPPLEISEAIGLLESYFDSKRLSDALPALQQLRALIAVGDGKPLVDRSLVIQEHMKWLEDPAHDLWLVPDGSSTQYFDLRTNDEKFTGYGVLTLKKEAQTVWQRIHESARNISSVASHSAFAHNVLDRLVSGLRAKIATHVTNNYYSHRILCQEAWKDAKKSSLSCKGCNTDKDGSAIPADQVSKHLLPQLSKKFPQTVGNSSHALRFLSSLFASRTKGVSQVDCCKAVECLYATQGCADHQQKGYEPNLALFSERLAAHPEHVTNIYFTWLFLLRALKKVQPKLAEYDYFSGTQEEADRTRSLVRQLLKHVNKDDAGKGAFKMLRAEKQLFRTDEERKKLLEIIRKNFHTISLNVDCIACESCRLQAKVKITGLAFAVRTILNDDLLRQTTYGRNDVIAFINTVQQFSKGLRIVHRLSDMSRSFPDPWIHSEVSEASVDVCPHFASS